MAGYRQRNKSHIEVSKFCKFRDHSQICTESAYWEWAYLPHSVVFVYNVKFMNALCEVNFLQSSAVDVLLTHSSFMPQADYDMTRDCTVTCFYFREFTYYELRWKVGQNIACLSDVWPYKFGTGNYRSSPIFTEADSFLMIHLCCQVHNSKVSTDESEVLLHRLDVVDCWKVDRK